MCRQVDWDALVSMVCLCVVAVDTRGYGFGFELSESELGCRASVAVVVGAVLPLFWLKIDQA